MSDIPAKKPRRFDVVVEDASDEDMTNENNDATETPSKATPQEQAENIDEKSVKNAVPSRKSLPIKPKPIKTITINKIGGMVEGRVTSKTSIRTFKGPSGTEEKIFSFIIRDTTGEINVVVAGPSCQQRFERIITVGACYQLNAFKQRLCNPQYRVADHDVELSLSPVNILTISHFHNQQPK